MKVGWKAVAVWLESGASSFSSQHLFPSQGWSSYFCVAVQLQRALPVLCAASAHTHTEVSLWFSVWSEIWVCGFVGTVSSAPGDDGFSPSFECTGVSGLSNATCSWGVSLFLQRRQGLKDWAAWGNEQHQENLALLWPILPKVINFKHKWSQFLPLYLKFLCPHEFLEKCWIMFHWQDPKERRKILLSSACLCELGTFLLIWFLPAGIYSSFLSIAEAAY